MVDSELEDDKIYFYDNNNKLIIKSSFQIFGRYFSNNNLWIWAWAIPRFKKKWYHLSRYLLLHGLDLNPNDNFHLKLELINSRFKISDQIQLDIHLAIASHISKQYCILQQSLPITQNIELIETSVFNYTPVISNDNHFITYYFLSNIEQIDPDSSESETL